MFKLKSTIKFFAIVFCFALIEAKHEFRCDYTYYPDAKGWLKLHEIPTNWHDARLRCQLEGAELASPTTTGIGKAMMLIRKNLLNTTAGSKTPPTIYTGIHSTYSLKDYASLDGIPLSNIAHAWAKGSPYIDAVGGADCLTMGPGGELAAVDGEEVELPYVCYKRFEKFTLSECGTVDPEYKLATRLNSCYKFHHVARSWRDAYKTCVAEGAHLVVINDAAEASFLRDVLEKFHVDEKPHKEHSAKKDYYNNVDNDENPELGAYENVISVGFTRPEVAQWAPITIFGQPLEESGYAKIGTKHQDKNGLCGAIDDKGFLINIACRTVWYRFICEKQPGRVFCAEDGSGESE